MSLRNSVLRLCVISSCAVGAAASGGGALAAVVCAAGTFGFANHEPDSPCSASTASKVFSWTSAARDGSMLDGSYTFSDLARNANKMFTVVPASNPLSEVDLSSTAGIAQSSHFELSRLMAVVPEPPTWSMLLLGVAGLGYAGFRRPNPVKNLRLFE